MQVIVDIHCIDSGRLGGAAAAAVLRKSDAIFYGNLAN